MSVYLLVLCYQTEVNTFYYSTRLKEFCSSLCDPINEILASILFLTNGK